MIGLDTGYFFRLAEKTEQSIALLHTAMEEERDVVVCTIAIYELLRHRMQGSLDAAVVDLVLSGLPVGRDGVEKPPRSPAGRRGPGPRQEECAVVTAAPAFAGEGGRWRMIIFLQDEYHGPHDSLLHFQDRYVDGIEE